MQAAPLANQAHLVAPPSPNILIPNDPDHLHHLMEGTDVRDPRGARTHLAGPGQLLIPAHVHRLASPPP